MTNPLITVLLPVYNGATYLEAAIRSILNQTFTDYEFLIINDGSKDQSAEILSTFTDARIKVIHQENIGLAATLNKGIALAKGRYIARQDQDDMSLPSRLEKQLDYMEAHPACALLGTFADIWVNDTPSNRQHCHATEHADLCFELLFNNPFVHSSVMLRSEAVRNLGGYSTDPTRQPPEDFEFWSRIVRSHSVANLPEVLLIYREVQTSMSRAGQNPFLDKLIMICSENFIHANHQVASHLTINDICALTHSAHHCLSKKPDINKMQQLIINIAKKIAMQYQHPKVILSAENRSAILYHQWMQYKLNKMHLLKIIKALHSYYKKIITQLTRLFSGSVS